MIDLNPLVISRHLLPLPPAEASPEEQSAKWYQITDKISYLPGVQSSVSYNACMHDLADGLQTHTFAPAGVEIRGKWQIGGDAAGEEARELGMDGVPRRGLYLREETELKCNFLMTGFIKKNLKNAHAKVVERIIEAARQKEPKPPVPAKDPGYHSRGPSVSSGLGTLEVHRPSSKASEVQEGDPRKVYTSEFERLRHKDERGGGGEERFFAGRSDAMRMDEGYRPPVAPVASSRQPVVAELSTARERPISELPG